MDTRMRLTIPGRALRVVRYPLRRESVRLTLRRPLGPEAVPAPTPH